MNSQHEPIAAKFMSPGKVVSQSEQFDQVCHFCNHTRHSPETHAYGMACPREPLFSIHIRSGDTTQGSYEKDSGQYRPAEVHQDYAPYPTSFYAQVLQKALELENTRLFVFCEDYSSPSCETVKTLAVSVPRIELRIGMPLEEDLRMLACSKDVAISPGNLFQSNYHRQQAHLRLRALLAS